MTTSWRRRSSAPQPECGGAAAAPAAPADTRLTKTIHTLSDLEVAHMSSHREAPAISKDPVADNTDTYAFVSPDDPDTVTIISNYLPLEAPFGGPNFFEFGDDVLYSIHIDNDADGEAGDHLRVQVPDRGAQPEHVPVQHGPDRVDRLGQLEPSAVLHGDPRGARTPTGARQAPRVPAVQHRAGVDAELRRARRPGDSSRRRRSHRVRGAATRRVLRRPRGDLRPRRPAPVPEPPHRGHGRGGGRQRHERTSACTRSR